MQQHNETYNMIIKNGSHSSVAIRWSAVAALRRREVDTAEEGEAEQRDRKHG